MMRRGRRRSWGWVPVTILVVLVILVVAVVALPSLVPVSTVRDRIVAAVHDATGRDLAIKGGLSLSVFPSLAVAGKDVTLSNAPWAGDQPMVSLGRLDVRLKLLPLLTGRVEVDSFVLENPEILLQTDKEGRGNWQFSQDKAAAAPSSGAGEGGGGGGLPSELSLGDVRISNGRLSYADGVTGKTEQVEEINLTVSLSSLDRPLAVDGSAKWRDRKLSLKAGATKPRDLLGTAGSALTAQLASEPVNLTFSGNLALGGGPKGEGDLDLAVPSLRELVAWSTGKPLALPGSGLGLMSLKSHVGVEGKQVTLGDLKLGLDTLKATGELVADSGGTRPSLKGKLDIDRLDLTPYLPPEENTPANAAPSSGKAASAKGWSNEPIDHSALKSADLDLALTAGSIAMRKIDIGKTQLTLKLTDGRLVVDLAQMSLYQGQAQGHLGLDGSTPALGLEATLKLDKLQAEPLLAAAADFDRLSGTVVGETTLSSRGLSERDLVGGLDGKGKFAFSDGSIKGLNLGAMLNNVASAFSGGGTNNPNDKTDFSELSGSYTIAQGIVKNEDLVLTSPLLQVGGSGTVNLPEKTMNYRLSPKLAASGAAVPKELSGLSVPVIVEGPWDNLSYRPDLQGAVEKQLQDPSKLLGDKGLGKLLPKIFGK